MEGDNKALRILKFEMFLGGNKQYDSMSSVAVVTGVRRTEAGSSIRRQPVPPVGPGQPPH